MPRMLHIRSTKAGRLIPATHASLFDGFINQCSLNEGREVNPGDTGARAGIRRLTTAAQRRPGG